MTRSRRRGRQADGDDEQPRGYSVSVRATERPLTGARDTDTIPIERSGSARDGGAADAPFTPLDRRRAIRSHSQDRPSAPGGDAVSNDYRVDIPFVASDTYSTELEYIVDRAVTTAAPTPTKEPT